MCLRVAQPLSLLLSLPLPSLSLLREHVISLPPFSLAIHLVGVLKDAVRKSEVRKALDWTKLKAVGAQGSSAEERTVRWHALYSQWCLVLDNTLHCV